MPRDKAEHAEVQEKGFIRTVKTPKPALPTELTVEERLAAAEARLDALEKKRTKTPA